MAHFAAVTPSDTVPLAAACPSFYVGTGGTLTVLAMGDSVSVQFTVAAGFLNLPWPIVQIFATGTSASGIIALGL